MSKYTVKCKPCGRTIVARTPRITEHELTALRSHIVYDCAAQFAHTPSDAQAGTVLAQCAVEASE